MRRPKKSSERAKLNKLRIKLLKKQHQKLNERENGEERGGHSGEGDFDVTKRWEKRRRIHQSQVHKGVSRRKIFHGGHAKRRPVKKGEYAAIGAYLQAQNLKNRMVRGGRR